MREILQRFLLTGILVVNCLFAGCASPLVTSQIDKPKTDTARLRICTDLINYYVDKGELDSSLLYVNEGLKLSKDETITTCHASYYRAYGSYLRRKSQLFENIKLFKKAEYWGLKNKQLKEVTTANYSLACSYLDIAMTYPSKKNFITGFKQLHENIRFARKYHLYNAIANNYTLIYGLYREFGNDSAAYSFLEKSNRFLEKEKLRSSDKLFLSSSYLELSLWHQHYDKAKSYLHDVIKYTPKDSYYYYVLVESLAVYSKFKQFDQAFQLASLIVNDKRAIKLLDNQEKLMLFNHLTFLYLHQANYVKAENAHQKAMLFLKKESSVLNKLFFWKNEVQLLEHKNRFREALLLTRKIAVHEESTHSKQSIFELAAVEERLESEARENILHQQIRLHKLENQYKEKVINHSKEIQILFTLIVVGLIAVIAIIIFQLKKIKKQSQELTSLNANQNRLFGIISHDLRSPVASLQAFLGIINANPTYQKITESFLSLEMQVATVSHTLNNLLNWSVSQMGGIKPKRQNVNLRESLQHILELMNPQILYKSIAIIDQLEQAWVVADENLVEIVLRNILSNAIKFSPAHGFIRLSSTDNGHEFMLRIQDSGVGMSEEQLGKLFVSFQSQYGTMGERGSGLGLKLSKDLMAIQEGSIEIKSQVGVGTVIDLLFKK